MLDTLQRELLFEEVTTFWPKVSWSKTKLTKQELDGLETKASQYF